MQQATIEVPRSGAAREKREDNRSARLLPWRRELAADSAPVEFVPTEHVLISTVTLGARQAYQRLASLPFAIEERLAQPIERAHVALGPRLGENLYLAAVVDESQMLAWLSAPRDDRREDFKLVPDIFLLPVPAEGAWHIATLGDRVLVRMPDETGFATQTRLLAPFHAAAGHPNLIVCREDGPLPDLPIVRSAQPIDLTAPALLFDLRQGRFAARKSHVRGVIVGLARTAAAGLIALTGLAAIDGYVLARQVVRAELALAAEVEARAPGAMNGRDVLSVIEGFAAGEQTDAFLTTLARAGQAWPANQPVQLRELAFSAADANFELLLEAGSIAELEGIAAGLETSGLDAYLGASTSIPGGAEGRIRIGSARTGP